MDSGREDFTLAVFTRLPYFDALPASRRLVFCDSHRIFQSLVRPASETSPPELLTWRSSLNF
jgi:hypothetical protein